MAGLDDLIIGVALRRMMATRPRITTESDRLVVRSGWKTHLWTLGSYSRKAVVEPKLKTIHLSTRYLWFLSKSRRIEFDWIQQVNVGYADMNPSSSFSWGGYDSDDLFTVAILLKNGEEIPLFRFFGSGDFVSGVLPDWWYWEEMAEAALSRGDQDVRSQRFADVLSGMIGVPIGTMKP